MTSNAIVLFFDDISLFTYLMRRKLRFVLMSMCSMYHNVCLKSSEFKIENNLSYEDYYKIKHVTYYDSWWF